MLLRSRCFPHPRRVVLALVASTLLTACFPGRRLLRGTIERDGAVLVEALFDVADTASELEALEAATAQVWTVLPGGTPIPEGELGPGAVLRLVHGDTPFAEWPCNALRLLPSEDRTGWRTSPVLVLEPDIEPGE